MRPKLRISVRNRRGLLCVLATVLLITACGSQTSTLNTDTDHLGSSHSTISSQQATTHYPFTIKDQAGHTVTIRKLPQHIASTTLGTDEILSALAPKDHLSMVTAEASDPLRSNILNFVKGIPQIREVNTEALLSIEPDLTLLATSSASSDVIDQLRETDTTTYQFSDVHSIQNIEDNINIIGKIVGKEGTAYQLVQQMEQRMNQIKLDVQDEKKVTVLVLSRYHPIPSSPSYAKQYNLSSDSTMGPTTDSSIWYIAGNGSTIHDVIEDAGGIDAATQMKGWQKITAQQISELDPDVILYNKSEAVIRQMLLRDPALQLVKAIQFKRIYGIPDAHLMSESQYIVKGIEDVVSVLYPDAAVRIK